MTDELWVDSADRKLALRALAEHHAESHLTDAEHERRAAAARSARNRADLHTLFADLPPPHPQLDDDTPVTGAPRSGLGLALGAGGVIVIGALIAQWWIPAVLLAVFIGLATAFTGRR